MLNISLALLAAFALCAQMAIGAELPAGGDALLGPEDLAKVANPPQHQLLSNEGPNGTPAIQADIEAAGDMPWTTQYSWRIDKPVKKGDVLHIRFQARNVFSMTGSSNLGVVFEMNTAPHSKSIDAPIAVGSQWETIDLPFVAKQDFEAGKSQLCIRLAYAKQKVQIAGLRLINYANTVKYADLPRVKLTYAGREADAQWRKDALQRIEKLRKADLKVVVRDAAGKPIPNAQVSAELVRHGFGFGTCVSMRLLEDSKDGEIYRQKVKELFSTVVIENELKWQNITGHKYVRSDALVAWLKENEIPTRGHCLVWPGQQFLPRHVLAMMDQPETLKKAVEDHVRETVSRYRGQLIDWDVINEPFANHVIMDRLGNGVMVDWFKIAHEADPNVKLFINDYEILACGNMLSTPHQEHYYKTIKYLIDQGAPISGIGMQGHFSSNITSPENLLKILDRYAALGLRIKVTELDINLDDQELRADYMRDFHIALFSHPAVDGILQWGFWEGAHWIPNAALFSKDWSIRPHGQAFVDLVHGQWKTTASGQTDASGAYALRGFRGTYRVTASANGKTIEQMTRLVSDGGEAVLTLQ